jgi:hypothetical protein
MEGNERPTLMKDVRLYALLAATAAALVFFLMDERAARTESEARIAELETRVREAGDIVREYREVLLPPKETIQNPKLLAEKSLMAVVMEAAEKKGIAPNLESVDPSEDKKTSVVRARVALKDVTLRQVVEFLLALKSLSAGIRDNESTLRMQGYNADSWRLEVTLEAPAGRS